MARLWHRENYITSLKCIVLFNEKFVSFKIKWILLTYHLDNVKPAILKFHYIKINLCTQSTDINTVKGVKRNVLNEIDRNALYTDRKFKKCDLSFFKIPIDNLDHRTEVSHNQTRERISEEKSNI